MPAPAKKLLRSLGSVRRVVMVPEYRTTLSCNNASCLNKPHVSTLQVYRVKTVTDNGMVTSKTTQVGSRYCPRCKCVSGRDASAAKNILAGGIARIISKQPPEALRCRAGKECVFGGRDAWYCTPGVACVQRRRQEPQPSSANRNVKRCGSS